MSPSDIEMERNYFYLFNGLLRSAMFTRCLKSLLDIMEKRLADVALAAASWEKLFHAP